MDVIYVDIYIYMFLIAIVLNLAQFHQSNTTCKSFLNVSKMSRGLFKSSQRNALSRGRCLCGANSSLMKSVPQNLRKYMNTQAGKCSWH